eukprot:TRINITY_DN789_c0_g1_i8.p1 TRINITY_DN789_c0_g1~~TRINITY_DN789_c0_g1_i8.p1  ORF type:complete len:209 (+),score=41.87 TRINITY_DN789_c0_g1_i8:483-1109(+)
MTKQYKQLKNLSRSVQESLKTLEGKLLDDVRILSSPYLKDLNDGFNSEYKKAIGMLEDDSKISGRHDEITRILGMHVNVPDTPPVFPVNFTSLMMTSTKKIVVSEKAVSTHWWYWLWMKDYVKDEVVQEKQVYKISEEKLRKSVEKHFNERNTVIFDHFLSYFDDVFKKKSMRVMGFIMQIFADAQDNLKRKLAQMEDKKKTYKKLKN